MFYFNTLYLQRVLGYSALEAGLAFLPFTAGIIIGAGLSQSLVPKLGAREVPLIGMPMAIVGLLLFMRLEPDGSYVTDLLPGDPARVDRHGPHVRPDHADRDERDSPRRRRPRVRPLQHVAADRRRARASRSSRRSSVEATEDTLTGLGREPQPADQAQALVDGFHVAYLGSALMIAGAFVALLFLLRREDVVAVGEGEAAIGTAAG